LVKVVIAMKNALGKAIYTIAYIPVWLFWHLGGKYVIYAFQDVQHGDVQPDIPEGVDISTPEGARAFIARVYYNYCYRQALAGAL
jgi:hypothetical protein